MSERVGFIGVGLMGHGMAKNVLLKGYPLSVMAHRNREPVDDLVGRGASEISSPAEMARACDVVFLCLSTSAVVEQVVTGADGLIEGVREGMVLVDTGTSDPSSTERLAALLGEKGVAMLDAPLGRTPIQAEEGLLNMMVGGDAAVFARIRPIFETMAENIFHVGPLGSGHKLKLINNVVAMTLAAIVSEAASTAARVGVDLEKMRDVMSAGPLNSGMFNFVMKMAIEGDPSSLQFTLSNARKDVGYFTAMAEANGIPTYIAPATKQALSLAVADGRGSDLVPQLYEYFKSKNF